MLSTAYWQVLNLTSLLRLISFTCLITDDTVRYRLKRYLATGKKKGRKKALSQVLFDLNRRRLNFISFSRVTMEGSSSKNSQQYEECVQNKSRHQTGQLPKCLCICKHASHLLSLAVSMKHKTWDICVINLNGY